MLLVFANANWLCCQLIKNKNFNVRSFCYLQKNVRKMDIFFNVVARNRIPF